MADVFLLGNCLGVDVPDLGGALIEVTHGQYPDDCILNSENESDIWNFIAEQYIAGYERALSDLEESYAN